MWDKILDIEKCHLQEDPSNQIRNFIKDYGIANDLEFFNPREQSGLLRTIMLRISSTGEIMVVIQFFQEEKEKQRIQACAGQNEKWLSSRLKNATSCRALAMLQRR